jgi:hypothetical protein
MKKVLALLLLGAAAGSLAPSPALAFFQTGAEAFSGNDVMMNGHPLSTIVINYDQNTICFIYADGGQDTFGEDHDWLVALGNDLRTGRSPIGGEEGGPI